jgi:hypothetical protein
MPLVPIEFAIKAVLIAVSTAGVLRILNVKTAAARHAAWVGVVVVMLLLPVWTMWGPKVTWHLLPPLPDRAAAYSIATADTFEPAIGYSQDPTLVPRHPSWNWMACLLGIYLVGVAVLLVRLTLGTLQARLLVRRAFHRDGKLFSSAFGAPVTVGWLRPVVVLPESWSQWPAAQLDAVLTHEHEHARRRDPLFQWLALLNRAMFWFHPLAWWLERRIAALAEEACDAVVLAHGHDPRDYSKYLIDMARSVSNTGARIQVWGMAMPGGFLEERIRRILEGGPLPRLSRARLVCACIACAATSAAFATSTLDHQRPAGQPDRKVVLAQNPAVPDKAVQHPMLAQSQQQAATGPPAASSDGTIGDVPRRLHVDIQGLSVEAAAELRRRLALREGETFDHAALVKELERIQQIVTEFDPHLSYSRMMAKVPRQVGADGKALPPDSMDVTLMISPRDSAPGSLQVNVQGQSAEGALEQYDKIAKASSIADVPRKLHVDIQGLSAEAAAELRQRLALQEGEVFDHAAFVKELERIHQIVTEFDPHLNDGKAVARVPRKVGADGKVLPPDSMDVTLIIAPRDSAPQPAGLEQYSKIARPPWSEIPPTLSQSVPIPIKLHLDIRGLSPEAAAELLRRLALQEGETTDIEALKKTVMRIRQVMREFDPGLTDEMHFGVAPNASGADGKPNPWDSIELTLVIRPTEPN